MTLLFMYKVELQLVFKLIAI